MLHTEWLKGLKEGDEVAVEEGGWGRHYALATVEKVTAHYITVRGTRYRRKSGQAAGEGGFRRRALHVPTPEIRDASIRRRLIAALLEVKWGKLTTEELHAAVLAIPAHALRRST